MLPANPANSKSPARVNARESVSAALSAGITETDIRRLLAGGRLGRTISDQELGDIAKGLVLVRWAMLTRAISACDKRLKIKNLPADVWLAVNRAKREYLAAMAQLTQELEEFAKRSAAGSNGQTSPHSFSPREQIGHVTAISVTVGNALEQPSVSEPAPHLQDL
jgi:hypothetical protein